MSFTRSLCQMNRRVAAMVVLLFGGTAIAEGLNTEMMFEATLNLDRSHAIDNVPLGMRRVVLVTGGSVTGPKLKGTFLPGGGDWILCRKDGACQLDARATFRTEDGALVYMTAAGMFSASPEVLGRMRKGEDPDPSEYYFRMTHYFETNAENYAWLNKVVGVSVGRRTPTAAILKVFEVK